MSNTQEFDTKAFVERQIHEIREILGKERALIAVSGGVDSSTCAALVHKAIGENLLCVMLDDAFMREGEPQRVAQLLSQPPLKLPIKILNVQERFLTEMKELRDAEEKRKVFRENFYRVLSETAQRERCSFLVQGTILADIVETAGGVKTQHNVLSQIGINPQRRFGLNIVEPLKTLFKGQVRQVARYLGIPTELAERQPFPGPGLSVRVVGEIKRDKLATLKKATAIAEERLAKHKPDQYFAVIIDNKTQKAHPKLKAIQATAATILKVQDDKVDVNVFEDKATGTVKGERRYGEVALIAIRKGRGVHQAPVSDLVALQNTIIKENPSFTRVFYVIKEAMDAEKKPYAVAIRAIQTQDFLTAKVAEIQWKTLNEIAEKILSASADVSCVSYDVTPKPPATIEME
jgi:GMP synthase (glutamine-hydrolysing)